jgi:DNA-binding NarL/FixJ family response regulator
LNENVRILIADDHPLIRSGLRAFINSLNVCREVQEAENGRQVLQLARETPFDLILLDFRMPDLNGYEVAKALLSRRPATKIIVISMYSDQTLVTNLIQLGVRGYIVKNEDTSQIEKAILTVLNGGSYFSDLLNPDFLHQFANGTPKSLGIIDFTYHEKELVNQLSKGHSTAEIATHLNLSIKSVETYRYRLLKKTRLHNTAELVDHFHRIGLIDGSP